ncbi:DUF1488 family protein [Novosphingobium sp. AP12]|uniref:DUF1488 family protein n=1 Tax=Novosphingobium sp. AP12 TaxID=1144305 RepID=UPI000271E2EC|nr:DUF1488 family protein [Novosphingobium sp. AP12]EJL21933.1 Protein of unknown function (DUF1488) [Novosphingobium sp. AP12]
MNFKIGFFDEDRTWVAARDSVRFVGMAEDRDLTFYATAEALDDQDSGNGPPSGAKAEEMFDQQRDRFYAAAHTVAERDGGASGSYLITDELLQDLHL